MMDRTRPGAPVILVVEDETLVRLLAVDLLEEEGFYVLEAGNAAAALQMLEQRDDVEVLFTDIQMPGKMDGLDLATCTHERWPHIRLLLTSGNTRPSHDEIPDDGSFIPKPYNAEQLRRQVGRLIET